MRESKAYKSHFNYLVQNNFTKDEVRFKMKAVRESNANVIRIALATNQPKVAEMLKRVSRRVNLASYDYYKMLENKA